MVWNVVTQLKSVSQNIQHFENMQHEEHTLIFSLNLCALGASLHTYFTGSIYNQ